MDTNTLRNIHWKTTNKKYINKTLRKNTTKKQMKSKTN